MSSEWGIPGAAPSCGRRASVGKLVLRGMPEASGGVGVDCGPTLRLPSPIASSAVEAVGGATHTSRRSAGWLFRTVSGAHKPAACKSAKWPNAATVQTIQRRFMLPISCWASAPRLSAAPPSSRDRQSATGTSRQLIWRIAWTTVGTKGTELIALLSVPASSRTEPLTFR